MADFRLPGDTHRLAIIGRTGSGKTQAAVWHLSNRAFDKRPWIVFNFKGDELIADLPGTKPLSITGSIPSAPGVYVVEVAPDEKEAADDFLMRVWAKQNTGLYIDEGYMLSGLDGYRRCLTQGRSRKIPMIILSQRPVWMDKFTFSEADFYQVFNVTMHDDIKTLESYIGELPTKRLPQYHSLYYDVSANETFVLLPVPDHDTLVDTFRQRLGVKRRILA